LSVGHGACGGFWFLAHLIVRSDRVAREAHGSPS
jgi:hypothetical protein